MRLYMPARCLHSLRPEIQIVICKHYHPPWSLTLLLHLLLTLIPSEPLPSLSRAQASFSIPPLLASCWKLPLHRNDIHTFSIEMSNISRRTIRVTTTDSVRKPTLPFSAHLAGKWGLGHLLHRMKQHHPFYLKRVHAQDLTTQHTCYWRMRHARNCELVASNSQRIVPRSNMSRADFYDGCSKQQTGQWSREILAPRMVAATSVCNARYAMFAQVDNEELRTVMRRL